LRAATYHWDMAKYETPMRPTRPMHHGWHAAHSHQVEVVLRVLLSEHSGISLRFVHSTNVRLKNRVALLVRKATGYEQQKAEAALSFGFAG
jgi:hypothetical protein